MHGGHKIFQQLIDVSPIRLAMVTGLFLCVFGCHHQSAIEALPADFENDRIYLLPTTPDGRVIRFVTDTGGGWNAIKRSIAKELETSLSGSADAMPLPDFVAGSEIPSSSLFRDGNLVVVEDSELDDDVDGFLGGRWFGNKIWEFDYLNERLSRIDEYRAQTDVNCHDANLGFQVDRQGVRTMHFARVSIEVDGQRIDVLIDTGAKAQLTESGAAYFGNEHGSSVGTSFIGQSIFDNWAKQHPEWSIVQNADSVQGQTYSMIEVPHVTVGRHTVGPVWFTARPDSAFVDYMSSMMDQTIYGALGGSAFKYFRLIMDYPRAKAYFCTD